VPTDGIATNKRRAVQLQALTAAPVALLVLLVGALALGPLIGLVLAVLVAAAIAVTLPRVAGGSVRTALGGRPADPTADARLWNLVEGLAIAAGVPVPDLVIVDDEAPNALAAGLEPRGALVAVTTGLLASLDRVQLEGVLAHELARIKSYDTRPATLAVPLLRLVGGSLGLRVATSSLGSGHLAAADLQGVAITRYPPGLAAALERIGAGAEVRAAAALDHLWIEPPHRLADPLVHPPLEERIATLREL
jgi:heat shock protein HtpX